MGVTKKSASAFLLLGLIVAAPLQGTEFSFLNHNARAAGLGGAFVAKADDVFTLYDNPAGLAFLRGLRFEAGCLITRRTMTASVPGSGLSTTSNAFQFWGNAALSWQPWSWVTLGFGYEGPFYSIWDRKEMGQFLIDVYFQYAWAKTRTASPPAIELTYGGNRRILGISVGFMI